MLRLGRRFSPQMVPATPSSSRIPQPTPPHASTASARSKVDNRLTSKSVLACLNERYNALSCALLFPRGFGVRLSSAAFSKAGRHLKSAVELACLREEAY